MAISEEFFAGRSQASQSSARHVAEALNRQLADSPLAALIVSGGTTPEECFNILANTELDWDRVTILPSDERCVYAEHDASNEGMIRRLLVTNDAAKANLISMFDEQLLADEQCIAIEKTLKSVPRPFSISLLGMGTDGHFASLFPDAKGIDEGLNPHSNKNCMLVRTTACLHPRISLTMPALLNSSEILLLFFGDDKREVYEQAKLPGSEYPVSRLLQQQRTPVRTIWAP
jgi:6-phosphogluconolactonase